MTHHARLLSTPVPASASRTTAPTAGAVLVLHGGAARGEAMAVRPTQLSVLRMVPIARRLAREGRGRVTVLRLLNSSRGWDTSHTPVDDVAWALEQVRERIGADVPVALVGHSLGGRAALLSAGRDGVRSVVALNPWVYESDGETTSIPADRRILVVHGDRDRIASPGRSAAVTETLRRSTQVGYVSVSGGKHAMLRRSGTFERLAADFVCATLLGASVAGPVSCVLAGRQRVEV